jgi:hypothetical protein
MLGVDLLNGKRTISFICFVLENQTAAVIPQPCQWNSKSIFRNDSKAFLNFFNVKAGL